MASIRSSVVRGGRGAASEAPRKWWTLGVAITALLLLAIGIHRAFTLADSPGLPRDGVGETRWYGFAVRPDLHEPLRRWLAGVQRGGGGSDERQGLDGRYDLTGIEESDRIWLLTVLRYSCPESTILLVAEELRIEPACRPELPEPLGGGQRRAQGIWGASLTSFLLFGLAVVPGPGRRELGRPVVADWLLAGLVGWALVAVLAGAAWAVGLGGATSILWAVPGVVGLVVWIQRLRAGGPRSIAGDGGAAAGTRWSTLEWACIASGTLMTVVSVWKILRSEVWSWDYLAVWGFRARKLASSSTEFLHDPGFNGSNPDYPLGLAFSWLTATGGRPPVGGDIRVATLVMLIVLGTLLWSMLRGASPPLRVLVVGALLGGPLIWDTEGLGLAELPLVMWVTAAVALWSEDERPSAGWWSLLFLGMVAWSKAEGLVVAVALGLPGALWMRSRGGGRAALLWLTGLGGSLVLVRWATALQTVHGTGFLDGAWRQRLVERLRNPFEVLDLLPGTLLHLQWVPWYLAIGLLAMLVWGARNSRSERLPLSGLAVMVAAVAVLGAYVLVYFGTYLSPADHVATSWHRIVAPVLWTFVLGWVRCWAALQSEKRTGRGSANSTTTR